jgi:hypothetical protein
VNVSITSTPGVEQGTLSKLTHFECSALIGNFEPACLNNLKGRCWLKCIAYAEALVAESVTMLADTLGVTRAAILHVDDLGMCHGGNKAFLELEALGYVTCGSVMVPCPWFPEIAEAAAGNRNFDLGVHLTLTSEWGGYRWAPLSTRSRASGLVDPDGYFWRDAQSLAENVVVEAAESELRAQIDRAIEAGIRPTHIDAHMAAAMHPDLLDVHVRLARDYGLFPILPRRLPFAPDPMRYQEVIAALDWDGVPLVDGIRGTLPVPEEDVEPAYRRLIEQLPPGVTHFALHCTVPGDIEAISSQHAPWRIREYCLLATGIVARWCEEAGVTRVGTRELQGLWRTAIGFHP